MSQLREIAFGLALIACTLGAILSQAVLVSARRSGVYRNRVPDCTLLESRHPDAFFVVMRSWMSRVNLFLISACVVAVGWVVTALIER